MRFNKVTAGIVVVVVVLLGVLAFHVRTGATADSVAVLKTTGMTCGSCSSKITKAVGALRGVAVTEVDVDGGWVIVGYDDKIVKPDAIVQAVKGSGFGSNVYAVLTPEQFRRATGRAIGTKAASSRGCCGEGSGCGADKRS